jgi:hypothetical protein
MRPRDQRFIRGWWLWTVLFAEDLSDFNEEKIGPAPTGVPLVKRSADKAAEWAPLGAKFAGGTLQGYISTTGPGTQYAQYWIMSVVLQSDSNQQAKKQVP